MFYAEICRYIYLYNVQVHLYILGLWVGQQILIACNFTTLQLFLMSHQDALGHQHKTAPSQCQPQPTKEIQMWFLKLLCKTTRCILQVYNMRKINRLIHSPVGLGVNEFIAMWTAISCDLKNENLTLFERLSSSSALLQAFVYSRLPKLV